MKSPESWKGPEAKPSVLEEWKRGLVVIATSSKEKQRRLEGIGMKNVTGLPAPDSLEDEIFATFPNHTGKADYTLAAAVADAKVQYAIEQGAADDALICGFDTIAHTTRNFEEDRERRYLRKPHDREEARKELEEAFQNLLEGRKDLLETERLLEGVHLSKAAQSVHRMGTPNANLGISTGISVRLPNEGNITHTTPVFTQLTLGVIDAAAHLGENEGRELIANKIEEAISYMEARGDMSSIAGGLDYSDPKIWEILQVSEVKPDYIDDSEIGLYKGLPEQALISFLERLAADKSVTPPSET